MTLSFGGTDNKFSSFENAKAAIVPVPYGRTVSYRKGTENGPSAILKASDNMELFDEELKKEIYTIGINTMPLLEVGGLNAEEMIDNVEESVSGALKHNKMPVILGGEHTVTIGATLAARKKYKDLSVLYFDAHYDLKDTYEGSIYNHACVARRLIEVLPVVEAGVRSLSKVESDFLTTGNIKVISMPDVIKNPDWVDIAKGHLSKDVYITIDLDVFDPSIMPSVGTPEPGGMGWYEFLKAIRDIARSKNIVGFDVVELSPVKDMIAADFMAAKLIYKILGYIFFKCRT